MNDKRPVTKGQRIAALIVVIMLVAMIILTVIFAFTAKPGENKLFLASLLCTILIPTILYITMWLMRKIGGDGRAPKDEEE